MTKQNKTIAVRGIAQASQRFRTEVARELGMDQPNAEPGHSYLAQTVITGELSKRMVELANQQLR
jgi:hypothetical protein